MQFIPAYHHHFGRQCRVADYGYTKLLELFEAIPHVVQVVTARSDGAPRDFTLQIMGGGGRKLVTLSHRAQVKRFSADLMRILKSQASKQLYVTDLAIVYSACLKHKSINNCSQAFLNTICCHLNYYCFPAGKVIGKSFDITDYGVCYIEDMLCSLPEAIVTVEGEAKEMVVAIPRRGKIWCRFESVKYTCKSQLPINTSLLKLKNKMAKGSRKSPLLFIYYALKIVAEQTSEEMERTKQFAVEAVDLLKHSPQCRMPFNKVKWV